MTDKTFTRAGYSTNKGQTQFRFTNDLQREKVLHKNGHANIYFYELGEEMSKAQATAFLEEKGLTEDRAVAVAKQPTRKDDEKILAMMDRGTVEYDEQSDKFRRLVAEKRRMFPSNSEEQILEIARFQAKALQKEFGDIEPDF